MNNQTKKLKLFIKGHKLYNKSLNYLISTRGEKKVLNSIQNTSNSLILSNTPKITGAQSLINMHLFETTNKSSTYKHNHMLNTTTQNANNVGASLKSNKYAKINLSTITSTNMSTYFFQNVSTPAYNIPTNLYYFLENCFKEMLSFISKPVFIITPDKVVIHIFYYLLIQPKEFILKKNTIKTSPVIFSKDDENHNLQSLGLNGIHRNKLNIICNILSGYFKKPVELELVRLYYPYYNSNIFVNLLGFIINNIKLRRIINKLFKKAIIKNPTKNIRRKRFSILPAFLSGIKIKVAGRLLTNKVIPKQTVKTLNRGALARGKVMYLETARFTNKNKRGAFSITILTGQIIQ